MKSEWVILYSVWLVSFGLLFIIPKKKRRLAVAAFLFAQLLTWSLGLAVVEFGLITYPVNFIFSDVNRSSFTYEFMAFLLYTVF